MEKNLKQQAYSAADGEQREKLRHRLEEMTEVLGLQQIYQSNVRTIK
jgi:hypothetical protein